MQIARNRLDTALGPSDWFAGAVYIDRVAAPSGPSRLRASSVHFAPGARTAWHTHPNGQTIYVLEGLGLCQHRGGPIEVIRPADRVFFDPGEEHWHGASATRFMTRLAMPVHRRRRACLDSKWTRAMFRAVLRAGAVTITSAPIPTFGWSSPPPVSRGGMTRTGEVTSSPGKTRCARRGAARRDDARARSRAS